MADKVKINALPIATTVSGGDTLPLVQGGITKQVDMVKIFDMVDVPLDAAAYWPLDEVPEIPDNAAGTLRNHNPFIGLPAGFATDAAGGTLTYSDGQIHLAAAANNNVYVVVASYPINTSFRVLIKTSASQVRAFYWNGSAYATTAYQAVTPNKWATIDFNFPVALASEKPYGIAPIGASNTADISAWYLGDASYTTPAIDASGHRIHGTIYGATPIDSDYGRALSFDGSNDYILATLPSAQNLLTLSIRAKVLATPGASALISSLVYNSNSSGYGFALCANSAKVARIYMGRTGASHQSKDIAYTWDLTAEHDYKLIYDTTTRTASLWVDGLIKGTTTAFDATANPASDRITIGRWAADYVGYYGPMIASHAIAYTRALSATEVLGLYKAKTLPKSYSLINWQNSYMLNSTITTSSFAISATSGYVIPIGKYEFSATSPLVQLQFLSGSTWYGASYLSGQICADGVNVRAYNPTASGVTVYYRKLDV